MPDEIDLNDEEEAALDWAWVELIREAEERRARERDVQQRPAGPVDSLPRREDEEE